MPALLAVKVPARVIAVLQDFLPAKLDAIDTALADGVTTPDVVVWHDSPAESVGDAPAVVVKLLTTRPLNVWPKQTGSFIDAEHDLTLQVTVSAERATEDATRLQRHLTALVAGIIEVLTIDKERLETVANPSPFAELVRSAAESINYGPESEQDGGEMTRSATIPIVVRTRESAA